MAIEHYVIDSDMSRFTVRAFATGMLSALGHSPTIAIREFSGEAEFLRDSLEQAAVHLKIKAGSLAVTDNVSDRDRREMERAMNDSVLEVARYPEIAFDSSEVSASNGGNGQYSVNMVGDLSLHGVTNSQAVSVQMALTGDLLRAHGEFPLRQTDYAIKLVSVAGGTLKIKDELKCSFDIVARKRADNK
jgi:polyisoprenoid-binding protein YceI